MSGVDWSYDRTLDVRGLACPLPVLKTRKILLGLASGQRLLVEATDPMSAIDIPSFCRESGHRLAATAACNDTYRFLITRK